MINHLTFRDNVKFDEFVEVILQELKKSNIDGVYDFVLKSESQLRSLLDIVYFASLEPEEGHYTTCSLYWSEAVAHTYISDLCIESELSVSLLRRLAPISRARHTAIRITTRNGQLFACGLKALHSIGLTSEPGRPGLYALGSEPNVLIHILGPSRIQIEIGVQGYEYRGGRILPTTPFYVLDSIKKLSAEFSQKVGLKVISDLSLDNDQAKLFGGLCSALRVFPFLDCMLRTIYNSRIGGTLLIIPSDCDPCKNGLSGWLGRTHNLSLLDCAVDHLKACVTYFQNRHAEGETQRLRVWFYTRTCLEAISRTIGELAACDGCVVLNRSLSVISFGAKISASREQAIMSSIKYVSPVDNHVLDMQELEKDGGMRLRSALWYCKTYPNVIALVVSQDQKLKVIWSENESAFCFSSTLSTIPEFG